MNAEPLVRGDATFATTAATAAGLIAGMIARPAGRTSVSAYETARLVSLAPWLTRHADRVRYLLATQRPDGGWGGPEGYALVPTLSAVEGLLATVDRDAPVGWSVDGVRQAVDRALRLLHSGAGPAAYPVPDLPAVDLTVPALAERIGERLTRPSVALDRWRGAGPPPLPAGMGRGRLDRVRRLAASGTAMPVKLLHALEALGPAARQLAGVVPAPAGPVGASPAATAAWLGGPDDRWPAALDYLHGVVADHDGQAPCAAPITVFERSWVLSNLARARVPVEVPAALVAGLRDAVNPHGAATGPGLPTDADTTAVTLYALARLGHRVGLACLSRYDTGAHFCTWEGEDGASVTTNAHVLEAFGWQLGHGEPNTATVVHRLTGWLLDQQQPGGAWTDRWHASPYYATCCAVLALHDHGGPRARPAVRRAVDWVLATQRPDGGWGRWQETAEETAYALHILLTAAADREAGPAVNRAVSRLSVLDDACPLWHDKDLYHPATIVHSAVVAARVLADGRRRARPLTRTVPRSALLE
ncbi:prenyltransferase/squalene oxidase repeat-containing protein [Micromonospora sp. KC213]|uniref:prenyltransferase/squalene oxidase repeat-containing protein n=1 Tax=Micromonospora sp. KC213 TaxID=2530378 RepID=UPI0010455483|nr:prenyltransferase/squalene oxidase repeat-containing protein [Micromonospora sp. KC213]TDC37240.1 prenyltransferase [Micromonospora sp. KC213]